MVQQCRLSETMMTLSMTCEKRYPPIQQLCKSLISGPSSWAGQFQVTAPVGTLEWDQIGGIECGKQ